MAIVGLVPTGFSSCFSRGGGIAARDDGTVCVCAQLHCLWMGGCADVTPNSMADFHGECGDGDVVFFFFSPPGPQLSFPVNLLFASKMDAVSKALTSTMPLT